MQNPPMIFFFLDCFIQVSLYNINRFLNNFGGLLFTQVNILKKICTRGALARGLDEGVSCVFEYQRNIFCARSGFGDCDRT